MLSVASLPPEVYSYVLGYVVVAVTNVTAEYLILRMVFPARRSPVLWFSYFLVKYLGDALSWYGKIMGASALSFGLLDAVWTYATGILSFIIVYQSFASDLVSVGVCAVACDSFAGVTTAVSAMASNAAWGLPLTAGYLMPIGPSTITECLIAALAYACLSKPISWLLRWLCLMAHRNRLAWGVAAACLIMLYVVMTKQLAASATLDSQLPFILPFSLSVVLTLGVFLVLRAREARKREQIVRECAELSSSYDRTIKAQLQGIERELAVLDGHERVLRELGSRDESVGERVRNLRRAYVHLSAGAFCDRPALDAVLATGARRLRTLGASPIFTVAAVPARSAVPATVALALLNLACEAAERTNDVHDDAVELRIRGVGDQVLFRLDVPERWGTLWARRFLSAFDTDGTKLVRERRQGDRRVVLVVSKGVAS